jgi:hypothetical protein
MPRAPVAMLVNPKSPVISEMTKKMMAHFSLPTPGKSLHLRQPMRSTAPGMQEIVLAESGSFT